MGDMFRSKKMVLCQVYIQPEAAYHTISKLGELGVVQFRDLNSEVNSFQKKFSSEVKRCAEMERKLRYVEDELINDEVKIQVPDEFPPAPHPRETIDLEAHLDKTEEEIRELSENAINIKTSHLELLELKHVLENIQNLLDGQEGKNRESLSRILIDEETGGRLNFVSGVIQRERVPGFERMLWRISRGNVFMRQMPLSEPFEDPKTGAKVYKTVFCAFFQGDQLKSRVMKVCSGYRASLYPVPTAYTERIQLLAGVKGRIRDMETVLNQTKDHRARVLGTVSNHIKKWIVMVRKMKAIYHTLNMFNVDISKKFLIAECWVPECSIDSLDDALTEGANVGGSSIKSFHNKIQTLETPPTHYKTNRFTQGFQNLIDSYGYATYREVNPALYTIITFPFLFAVMFGDAGHGVVVALFGGLLVFKENYFIKKKMSGEIWNIFFGGRYIIFLMGLFSIYTGLIYNDVFSKSFNIFGSAWQNKYNESTLHSNHFLQMNPTHAYDGKPYPFGLDPVWQLADNKIIFQNSYKMKLSIIIAVCHMLFGVCVGIINMIHFRHYFHLLVEFLPHVLFLSCLILYMVFMFFFKWFSYSADEGVDIPHGPMCAPSILIMFIGMILQNKPDVPQQCDLWMYENQHSVQLTLFSIAMACIPVMLCGKPIIVMLSRTMSKHKKDPEEQPMSEVWINQAIHTIEYCLNTISHTASYLRLWALSLAHAQLSEVIWNMLFRKGFNGTSYSGCIMLYIFFAVWAGFSLSILILMEGLSAFLHTLRLHWVEFMTKFFEGLGEPFLPFCFKSIMEAEEAET